MQFDLDESAIPFGKYMFKNGMYKEVPNQMTFGRD